MCLSLIGPFDSMSLFLSFVYLYAHIDFSSFFLSFSKEFFVYLVYNGIYFHLITLVILINGPVFMHLQLVALFPWIMYGHVIHPWGNKI